MINIIKFPRPRTVQMVPKPAPNFVLVGEAAAAVVRRLQFRSAERVK